MSSTSETTVNWSKRIRQVHRWLSLTFTVVVIIVTIAALGGGEAAEWVYLLPLLPLGLLLFSGLYLFALPYAAKWRSGRSPT